MKRSDINRIAEQVAETITFSNLFNNEEGRKTVEEIALTHMGHWDEDPCAISLADYVTVTCSEEKNTSEIVDSGSVIFTLSIGDIWSEDIKISPKRVA